MGRKCPKGFKITEFFRSDPGTITLENGYYAMRLNGYLTVRLHRFVWMLRYGDPGSLVIHHVNGNKFDNRIENLRAMPHGEHSTLHQTQRYAAHRPIKQV